MTMPAGTKPAEAQAIGIAELQRRAVAWHQAGRLAEAVQLYRRILAAEPAHFETLHLLGLARFQCGDVGEALPLIDRALKLQPQSVAALNNRAVVLITLGRPAEAIASLDRVLALQPSHVDAAINRGNALQNLGRHVEAIASYDRAIACAPAAASAYNNRGNAFMALGRLGEALASFDAALRAAPNYAEAHLNRANTLQALARPAEALACYDQAITRAPNYAAAHFNRGNLLQKLGRVAEALASYDCAIAIAPGRADLHINRGTALDALHRPAEALASYDRALANQPASAQALYNRGNTLKKLGRFAEALASYDAGLRLEPGKVEALVNRADVLCDLDRYEEALAGCDRALAVKPADGGALNNRGNILRALGRYDEAILSYSKAVAVAPDNAGAHFNRGWCRLLQGDFDTGWDDYEWRQRRGDAAIAQTRFAQPVWRGGPELTGKTILLHAEQGFGDTIQFCRYAKRVADEGAAVILAVQPELKSLLGSLAGPLRVISHGEALPDFDFHCPLPSLPHAFRTNLATIPAQIPYLAPAAELVESWMSRIGGKNRFRVGLAWSGNADFRNDRHRPIPLAALAPLQSLDIELVSLHREVRPADRAALAASMSGMRHFGAELGDFADTAALLSSLDLVITVDTAIAHLAGALGKPVWILLSRAADWRWLLDCDDSPWYPTARLFRQPRLGDWASVIGCVMEALPAALSARAQRKTW